MDPMLLVILMTALVLVLLALGMPVAFSLAACGIIGMAFLKSLGMAVSTLEIVPLQKIASYFLVMVPMFILMGQLAYAADLSKDAYNVGNKWLGQFPGGLGIATVAASALFGACSGSTTAAAAALGKVCVPEMRKFGYDPKLAAGLVASAGTIANLIPPSIGFVVYGILTGESIGKLLISGIVPGILTAVVFALVIFLIALKAPHLAPRGAAASWKERLASLPGILPILLLFGIIIVGIYTGIATSIEIAGVGAFAAFVMALIIFLRRHSSWNRLRDSFQETVSSTAMIFTLFIGAGLFSYFLTLAGLPFRIQQAVASTSLPPIAILLLVLLMYVPLGMFLDPMSMQVLTIPIVYPTLVGLGYSGIWLGVLIMKLIEIGMLTPPVGLNVFALKAVVPDIPLEDIFRGTSLFLTAEAVIVTILIALPQLSLWLPNAVK